MAVLASQLVSFLWFSFETRKLAQLNPRLVLLAPCLVGLAAAALGRAFQLPLKLAVPVLALSYMALLLWRAYGLHPKVAESVD